MATKITNQMAKDGITALADTDLNILRKALELAIKDSMNLEYLFTNDSSHNERRRELLSLIKTKLEMP